MPRPAEGERAACDLSSAALGSLLCYAEVPKLFKPAGFYSKSRGKFATVFLGVMRTVNCRLKVILGHANEIQN